jgi:argininosuccinate lyase
MRKQPSEQYRGFRQAGIRLSEDVLPDLVAHRSDVGMTILYGVHAFDKAHLAMLAEEDLIPRDAAVAMLRTLRETESAEGGFQGARRKAGGGMHSAEYLLIQRLGEEVGGHIHLGRSSGDLGAVSARIVQRDSLLEIMGELNAVRAALLDLAEEHTDTVMPGYLQGQHAQPITLGHQLAAWAATIERDFARAIEAYGRINVSPAGAAIMTGSDFPVNRARTSELLGFDRPAANAYDAIMSQDTLLDSFCVLAMLNSDVARWADDLLLYNTSEYAFVDIPDRFCGTSSILMQTRSPYAPQLMKGLAASSVGGLVTAFLVEKSPTGLALMDRQYSADALWRLHRDTLRDLRWWRSMLPALRWNRERMAEMAGLHWAQATDVAGALVRERGLPWRTAHQIVGILVRLAEERGLRPADTTTDLLDEAAVEYHGEPAGLSPEALSAALDPRHFVEARDLYGGPAPAEARRRIADMRSALERDEGARSAAAEQVDGAARELEAAIDALIGA